MADCQPDSARVPGRPSAMLLALWAFASLPAAAVAEGTDFRQVYDLLQQHCGECHIQGVADGPWSLNTPPSGQRFPQCLAEEAGASQLRCASYHQLVDEPAPGIPAWIRPSEAPLSEPYAQACDPEASFHIGHSLPAPLPEPVCSLLLDWIESGAPR